jgi:GNAT superfamily N-acetyltransferase
MTRSGKQILRVMTEQDIPSGMRLCHAAGWNQLEDDWRIFLLSPGGGAFVVETGDRVLGTVAHLRYGRFGWVAMMLVDPDERRAGIGGQLMESVLSALADAEPVGLDATPLGEPLYRRFGFVIQSSLVRAKANIDAARFRTAGRARPMTKNDLMGVFARDREVFGADRAHLLRSLFERCPECAWITEAGYCFGRPGRLYCQLGPVVAETPDAARAVVSHCLSYLDGRRFAIDVPLYDADWLAWLKSAGFEVERPFVRMFRQGHTHPGIPARQYAIAGPEYA